MSTQRTATEDLARVGSVMTEFVAVVDLEDLPGSLRLHLTRLKTINQGLLTALEYIKERLEPRPPGVGSVRPLEDAAYLCYEVADGAVEWAGER